METIEKIRAKRKTVRFASTKFVNKVKSFLETFDSQNETHEEQLSEYLLNLDAKQIELQTLNKEVEDLLSDKELFEAEIEGSLEYEENINEVKSKINKIPLSQPVVNSKGANESNGSASKFKPFGSNRISKIQENTDPVSWRHCSGKQNQADLLTRGLTNKEHINSEKWWHGPEWLKDSESLWPKLEGFESMDSETVELKSSLIVNLTITYERVIDPDKYSSLLKPLRITAYIFRFVNALRRKDIVKGPLEAEELSNAEIFLVKVTQPDFYTSEITCLKNNKTLQKDSKLLCLNPFLDNNRVLRVTGRLGKTTHLSANEKYPIILPLPSLG
ncbi:integrase catalytic domain-containing protein [Trichonephila clavipes]|nr:integrase catalytic domain-containing protein [Trichonephila clavipes]